MPHLDLILGGLVVVFGLGFFFSLFRKPPAIPPQDLSPQFLSLQQHIAELQSQMQQNVTHNNQFIHQQLGQVSQQVQERLGQTVKASTDMTQSLNERMDNAARVFGDLQNRLGKLGEANEKIFNLGKDISSLQEILRNPKARGGLGEIILERVLAEMFPRDRFEVQYSFKNNEKVDAVIKLGDHLLPIDSKFPLENFKRILATEDETEKIRNKKMFCVDVKKHIDAIARKYILPDEGTFDFAFMYIPSENIFYEVIIRDDDLSQEESLHAYALKKRVIPVSPNGFYAYLGALMHALRGENMQKNILEITSQIRQLSVELDRFKGDFEKVGFHLNNLKTSYESAEKRLGRYSDKMQGIDEVGAFEPQAQVKLIS
ncbi:MAG TPA: hypothetical protein DDW49_01670 [Deltaproteobacteria bacterium]|nr:MAG: hypothetical protein A2048_04155 [Deltaproteobacteria bacterium GWA2_45_12]HBF12092.1 hypothetical protein [Deltaproteobacteria bacterium]